jgi:hypothetical protein
MSYFVIALALVATPALVLSVLATLFTLADDADVLPEPMDNLVSPKQAVHSVDGGERLALPGGRARTEHGRVSAA